MAVVSCFHDQPQAPLLPLLMHDFVAWLLVCCWMVQDTSLQALTITGVVCDLTCTCAHSALVQCTLAPCLSLMLTCHQVPCTRLWCCRLCQSLYQLHMYIKKIVCLSICLILPDWPWGKPCNYELIWNKWSSGPQLTWTSYGNEISEGACLHHMSSSLRQQFYKCIHCTK